MEDPAAGGSGGCWWPGAKVTLQQWESHGGKTWCFWKTLFNTKTRTGKSSGRKRVGQIVSQTQPHSLPTRLVTFMFWYCFLWRQFSVGRPCKLCTKNCSLQQLYLICHSWGVAGGRTHVAFLQPLLDEKCVNEEEGLKKPPLLQIASFCRYADRTEQHWQFRKFENHRNQLMDFFSVSTTPKSWPLVQIGHFTTIIKQILA